MYKLVSADVTLLWGERVGDISGQKNNIRD